MTRTLAIVDLETTGLDPERYEAWEFGVILRTADGAGAEHLYRVEPDLAKADPGALRKNRYYERTTRMRHRDTLAHDLAKTPANRAAYWSHAPALAAHLARLLDDTTFLASNPTFDTGFLSAFLRRHGQAPTWNHRVRDFPSMAYGYLRFAGKQGCPDIDASTVDFAAALGLNTALYDLHTAMGDCLMLADGLDVIEGRAPIHAHKSGGVVPGPGAAEAGS